MKSRFRRVAVFAGAAALAAGAGIGVAASSNDSASSGSSRSAPGIQQGPGRLDVSALADELGVTEAQLQEAMRKTRPTDPSAGDGPDDMFQSLADELGLSVDKVRQAFDDAFGNAAPQQSAPPGATSQS